MERTWKEAAAWPVLRYQTSILMKELMNTMKFLSLDKRPMGRDSNTGFWDTKKKIIIAQPKTMSVSHLSYSTYC
jgi:hypothetical protein